MNEIDEIFFHLKGVEQLVVGNIALARHNHFFLNLADADKLAILNERGHGLSTSLSSVDDGVPPPAQWWNGLSRLLPAPRQGKSKKHKNQGPQQLRLW